MDDQPFDRNAEFDRNKELMSYLRMLPEPSDS